MADKRLDSLPKALYMCLFCTDDIGDYFEDHQLFWHDGTLIDDVFCGYDGDGLPKWELKESPSNLDAGFYCNNCFNEMPKLSKGVSLKQSFEELKEK